MSISWDEQLKLLASDKAADDYFGRDVAIDGNYAIVGAYLNDDPSDSGSAYIFKKNENDETWTEQMKLVPSDPEVDAYFGHSVSISSNYAIVGAYKDNNTLGDEGAAYIFKKNNDETWTEQMKLLADKSVADVFGNDVSIDGNYAIIGASGNDSKEGSAYIFKKNSDETWSEQIKLVASDVGDDDEFGTSVAIDGNYAIIGAPHDDDGGDRTGSAYIFKKSDSNETWSQQIKLVASDPGNSDDFGYSVSISSNYAIIGARYSDDPSDSGSAYIFKKNENDETWTEQIKLVASDAEDSAYFGWSAAISGKYAIVGARRTDSPYDSGSAYIFKKNNDETWSQQMKLVASDKGSQDYFGNAVAINGNYAIVGASQMMMVVHLQVQHIYLN